MILLLFQGPVMTLELKGSSAHDSLNITTLGEFVSFHILCLTGIKPRWEKVKSESWE